MDIQAVTNLVGEVARSISNIRFVQNGPEWIVYPDSNPFRGVVMKLGQIFTDLVDSLSTQLGRAISAFTIDLTSDSIVSVV